MKTAVLTPSFAELLSHCDIRPLLTMELFRLYTTPLSNEDLLKAHGVSCMLQVVSSLSYRKVILQQLTAVSVIIVCCEISARLTGLVLRARMKDFVALYSLAQKTQVLQESYLTPYVHMSPLCQHMHMKHFETLTISFGLTRIRPRPQPRNIRFRFWRV